MDNQPGTCLTAPWPAAVFDDKTVSWTGVVRARATPTGPLLPLPLKTGKYFFDVVYPGNIVATPTTPQPVSIVVWDAEAPKAEIKQTIARNAGYICAKGATRAATTACVSIVDTAATGILNVTDNCGSTGLTRKWTCQGKGCPTTAVAATAKSLCVPVRAGKGRVEATFTLVLSDKQGNKSPPLAIPIAGYHFSDAVPTGTTCYKA